ncbi:uncharacterized protein TNCV_1647051 [Trichonephila clavipes]|nr:uncharacterized protein TNCV_1647051 [Trichonephila clavipes]
MYTHPKIKGFAELINELKEYGIFVSDASVNENCCLFEREPNEIHMLLVADIIGNLLIGDEVKHIKGGLVAVKHIWAGQLWENENGKKERHSNVLLSLHVSDNCIKDLWSLDVLGIKDPFEKKRLELS